jgi:hypothetical protein
LSVTRPSPHSATRGSEAPSRVVTPETVQAILGALAECIKQRGHARMTVGIARALKVSPFPPA